MLNSSVSDFVGERVRELRRKQGITGPELAKRCANLGLPHLSAATISNLETGRRDEVGRRRRNITVDELMALALALNVAPVHLLVPITDTKFAVTPEAVFDSGAARAWVRGVQPLTTDRFYFTEVPGSEWKVPKVDRVINWDMSVGDPRPADDASAQEDEAGDVDDG